MFLVFWGIGDLKRIVLISSFFAGFSGFAFAEVKQIGTVFYDRDARVAAIFDEVTTDTPNDFRKVLAVNPRLDTLILDSPGGVVASAVEIALEVHERGLSTYIPAEATCASACSIVFFAGDHRQADGELGVHQMSGGSPDTQDIGAVQYVVAVILDAFEEFDVHRDVSRRMLTTPAEGMYFFSSSEKTALGINRPKRSSGDATEPGQSTEQFSFYPADNYISSSDQVSYPDFAGRDRNARYYRTRIREGLSKGANFAGHYSLIEIGCGTSCRFAYVVDALTGEVFSFPYGGEENYQLDLLFNIDSKLVKATWQTFDEKSCTHQDLLWTGKKFEVLNETKIPLTDFYCG